MPGTRPAAGSGRSAAGRLQATTVAHRVTRVLRSAAVLVRARTAGASRGRTAADPAPAGGASTGAGTAPAVGGAAAVAWAASGPLAGDPLADEVCARARAAGAPAVAAAALADVWPDLTAGERRGVARPLGDGRPGTLLVGGAPARQVDATTCGSAVLAMLAAQGDPLLALWLVTGRLVAGHLPPELGAMPAGDVTATDAARRLAGLQRVLKRASTRRALGPLPWPAALGTPPWGAARAARFADVRWTHVLVDDTDGALLDAVLDRADLALAAGVPVPLFTGGDLGGGLSAAVPRHVVLLVPLPGPAGHAGRAGHTGYAVYEPSSAAVHRVSRAALARAGGPHPALGGWSHVCWAVLPR